MVKKSISWKGNKHNAGKRVKGCHPSKLHYNQFPPTVGRGSLEIAIGDDARDQIGSGWTLMLRGRNTVWTQTSVSGDRSDSRLL